jgi:hypothetical protein
MNKQHFRKLQHEKGMATLVIVLLLLFVATLVTLYTANTAVREQQVSANQYRADQALSAANAGLDYAIAYYSKYAGPDAVNLVEADLSGDGFIDVLTVPNVTFGSTGAIADINISDADLATLRASVDQVVFADVWFTDVNSPAPFPTDDRTRHLIAGAAFDGPHTIKAVGYSDDRSATRTISVEVGVSSSVGGGGNPGFPLVAKGIADSGGNWTIINRFSNATVWSGDVVPIAGSGGSFLREVDVVIVDGKPVFSSPVLTPPERMVSFEGGSAPDEVLYASYSKSGLNSDVIDRDDNLKNLDVDDYFKNFMISGKDTLKQIATANGQRFNSSEINWEDDLVGLRGLIWVDVDEPPAAGDAFPTWRETGNMPMLGTELYPVTLIVNGSFYTAGSGLLAERPSGLQDFPRMTGLLYVIGNWEGGGNFVIQGSALIEGEVLAGGSPTLVFDNRLYDGSLGNPPGAFAGIKAGTWKDW